MLRAATFLGGVVPNATTFGKNLAVQGRFGTIQTNSSAQANFESTSTSDNAARVYSNSNSFGGSSLYGIVRRAANSAFNTLLLSVNDGADNSVKCRGDGAVTADGAFTGGGADHAWMKEWADGNPKGEDRVGLAVVRDGADPATIRKAKKGETPHYVTIAPETATTLSNASPMGWQGKWARDPFRRRIEEEIEVEIVEHNIDGHEVKRRAKIARLAYADNYDPTRDQVPRTDRPEWAACSRLGIVRLRKGQPTAPGWAKLRDISDTVEEWEICP